MNARTEADARLVSAEQDHARLAARFDNHEPVGVQLGQAHARWVAAREARAALDSWRWGNWGLGTENTNGQIEFGANGTVLYWNGGPWGIELTEFRTPQAYERWAEHIAGKGWGTAEVINWLNLAFTQLNPSLPECQVQA